MTFFSSNRMFCVYYYCYYCYSYSHSYSYSYSYCYYYSHFFFLVRYKKALKYCEATKSKKKSKEKEDEKEEEGEDEEEKEDEEEEDEEEEEEGEESDEEDARRQTELNELKLKCLNNLVTTYQKLDRDSEALTHSNMVLALDSANVKALFRKAKILAKLNEWEQAVEVFAATLALEPANLQFKEELQRAKQSLSSHSKKMRSVYSSMLKGLTGEDQPSETPPGTPQKAPPADLDTSRSEIDVVGESPAKQPPTSPAKQPPAPAKSEVTSPVQPEPQPEKTPVHKPHSVKPPPKPKTEAKVTERRPWWLSTPGLSAVSILVVMLALYISRAVF